MSNHPPIEYQACSCDSLEEMQTSLAGMGEDGWDHYQTVEGCWLEGYWSHLGVTLFFRKVPQAGAQVDPSLPVPRMSMIDASALQNPPNGQPASNVDKLPEGMVMPTESDSNKQSPVAEQKEEETTSHRQLLLDLMQEHDVSVDTLVERTGIARETIDSVLASDQIRFGTESISKLTTCFAISPIIWFST